MVNFLVIAGLAVACFSASVSAQCAGTDFRSCLSGSCSSSHCYSNPALCSSCPLQPINPPVTCPAGTVYTNGHCETLTISCPAGSSNQNGICVMDFVTCPVGSYNQNGQCVRDAICPPGAYLEGNMCILPVTCPKDTYLSGNVCIRTPTCPDGTIEKNGRCEKPTITPCPPENFYINGECRPCPSDTYYYEGQCLSCRSDMTYLPAERRCVCRPGFEDMNNECVACGPLERLVGGRCVRQYCYGTNCCTSQVCNLCFDSCIEDSVDTGTVSKCQRQCLTSPPKIVETTPSSVQTSDYKNIINIKNLVNNTNVENIPTNINGTNINNINFSSSATSGNALKGSSSDRVVSEASRTVERLVHEPYPIPVPYPVARPYPVPQPYPVVVTKNVPQPYPVMVTKQVPVPYPVPQPVPMQSPCTSFQGCGQSLPMMQPPMMQHPIDIMMPPMQGGCQYPFTNCGQPAIGSGCSTCG